jgi:3-oxoacyl-[acyl-carrier-protein] synthase II
MTPSSRRAVFTGIGVFSSIGQGPGAFWEALRTGANGIHPIRSFDASSLPVRIAGEVADFDARRHIDKKQAKSLKMMARGIQFAVAAAQQALDDSGIDKERLDPTRFGVEFGSGIIASELVELGEASLVSVNCQPGQVDLARWGAEGQPTMPPLWMLKYLPNMSACHISILHNAQGPNNTITENDVSGLLALGEAYRVIGRDAADFMLVGGAESKINPLSMSRQCLFELLSQRNEAPERACRPFDRRRDGLVLGEGAGVLVLEELEQARRRGARVYAELVGFGAAFDPDRSGGGLARAVRHALAEAAIAPEQIDHINAAGFSTADEDAWEARGLHAVFAECGRKVSVFASKSYFGNLGAGSAPVELAASLLALRHGMLPPTRNYEEPDPACPVTVATALEPTREAYVLKVSMTQMGQCAAVVCRKWD